ncbi:hypothetical protein LG943_18975 [Streptomonospora sp. S1-112]|uniref:Uncharacterized protein n=1 Tax=Streptomonospora mangrovi TaxID=2883123 RepID=A0A9X3SFY9_9ACTN|nr:hypothetical protein [Streptomonospora mangrovi]MDA0566382.1 hypothetical protein [Streptomonospora mangrovi]
MSCADDHPDPQPTNRGAPRPRPRDWLDAYVDWRVSRLEADLAEPAPGRGAADGADPAGAPGGRAPAEDPRAAPAPPVPEVAAPDLAAHLAELAERYRRRSG